MVRVVQPSLAAISSCREPFHFPECDGAKNRVAEPIEDILAFLGDSETRLEDPAPCRSVATGRCRRSASSSGPTARTCCCAGPPRLTRRSCRSRSIALWVVSARSRGQGSSCSVQLVETDRPVCLDKSS